MSGIAQSVAWWGFVPEIFAAEQFVRAVAEAGYAAVDLAPQAYWPLVRSYGLALAATEAHASIQLGLNRFVPAGDPVAALRNTYAQCAACV